MTVGTLVQNAGLNESYLCTAFWILSGCHPEIAGTIFYSLDAFQAKKGLLRRIVDITGDAEDKKLVTQIIAAAEKSNNQRQQVSHALLSGFPNSEDLNLSRPKTAVKTPVTKEYLADLREKSAEALLAGHEAYQMLYRKHGEPLKQYRPESSSKTHP